MTDSKKEKTDLMTDQERHISKVEEAMLSEFGRLYTEQILEEQVQYAAEIEATEVPPELDLWFENFIKEQECAYRAGRWQRLYAYASKYAAVLILITVISTVALTMSVDAVRVRVLNTFLEIHDRYGEVTVVETPPGGTDYFDRIPGSWGNFYYPSYLPEGFEFMAAEGSGAIKVLTFSNPEGERIVFKQLALTVEGHLDTENAEIREVEINGHAGILIEKGGRIIVYWHTQEKIFTLQADLDKRTVMEIAQSTKKK